MTIDNKLIGTRISGLLGEREFGDKKVQRLAAACDTDRSRVHAWLDGKSAPRVEALIAICEYFDVSADYILGLSEEMGRAA